MVYHAHTTNIIALTFVLPLEDRVFTRELWEMATECPVVFPAGVGVVPWMVPGGREIAVATSELMKKYDLAIWAHHGMFAAGEDFDLTFGLMHTAEKSAEILVKTLSMRPDKLQTIQPDEFQASGGGFSCDSAGRILIREIKNQAVLSEDRMACGIRKPPGAMERHETLDCQPGVFLWNSSV